MALSRVHGDQSDDGHGPDNVDEPLYSGHLPSKIVLATGLHRNIREIHMLVNGLQG